MIGGRVCALLGVCDILLDIGLEVDAKDGLDSRGEYNRIGLDNVVRSVVGRGRVVVVAVVVLVIVVLEGCDVASRECGVDSCVVVGGKVVADVCGVSGLVMVGEVVMGVVWGKVESMEWRKGGCQKYRPTNSRHTSTRPPKDHSPRVLMLVF